LIKSYGENHYVLLCYHTFTSNASPVIYGHLTQKNKESLRMSIAEAGHKISE